MSEPRVVFERWILPSDAGTDAEKCRRAAWHATFNAALTQWDPEEAVQVAARAHGRIQRIQVRERGCWDVFPIYPGMELYL